VAPPEGGSETAPRGPLKRDEPPAARIVLEGKVTEREAELERKLKERERRQAELEAELAAERAKPHMPPVPEKKKGWLDGATFFD